MATVGPVYPTVAASAAGAAPETAEVWLNPANIQDADADEATIVAATYDTPDVSQILTARGFDFSAIPDGATINGILVEISRRSIVASSGKDFRVQLKDAAGALVGTNKAVTATIWPSTLGVASYGGAADTWSASPTAAMVKDPDFGVAISCQANIANADVGISFVRMTITYTDTTPPAVNVTSAATARVSQVAGFNDYAFSFTVDEACQAWKIKIVPNSSSVHTEGTQIESGGALASGATASGTLTQAEMAAAGLAAGANVVKFFAQDNAGNWST